MRAQFLPIYLLILVLLGLPTIGHSGADAASENRAVLMDARSGAVVHSAPRRNSAVVARIDPGATVKVTRTETKAGCPLYWYARSLGGFICGNELRPSAASTPGPGPLSNPDILRGLQAWRIERGGSKLYLNSRHVDGHRLHKLLFFRIDSHGA